MSISVFVSTFTIKYLRRSWFLDVCSFVKFDLHKVSDSMMYNLPILWKKNIFPWRSHQKYAIVDFCFSQASQGRSSWCLSCFWSGMSWEDLRFIQNLHYPMKIIYLCYSLEVVKLNQKFRKNKVVAGKTPFFVIGQFCTYYSLCVNIGFRHDRLVWRWRVFNLGTFN